LTNYDYLLQLLTCFVGGEQALFSLFVLFHNKKRGDFILRGNEDGKNLISSGVFCGQCL
jgi:hypothetical protein